MVKSKVHKYAGSLLKLALEKKSVLECDKETQAIVSFLDKNPLATKILCSPMFEVGLRESLLSVVFKQTSPSEIVQYFCLYLLRNNLFHLFPEIGQSYERISRNSLGQMKGIVRSAIGLTEEEKTRITRLLEKMTQKKLSLHFEVDPDLIGGFQAQCGSLLVDNSLKKRLLLLRNHILSRYETQKRQF